MGGPCTAIDPAGGYILPAESAAPAAGVCLTEQVRTVARGTRELWAEWYMIYGAEHYHDWLSKQGQ